jgi:hypothetical protein
MRAPERTASFSYPCIVVVALIAMVFDFPSATGEATVSYPRLSVAGDVRIIFSYASDRCDESDIPDASLRAFRDIGGNIVAFSTEYANRRFIGSSILKMKRDCAVVYEGGHLEDPAKFDDRTWIAATFTEDGKNVLALGHNEYQADKFPGKCHYSKYSSCWYNAIVPLQSDDGGRHFFRADKRSPEPVAAAPIRSDQEQGKPRGYFNPTNIVSYKGMYFALIAQSGFDGKESGPCLFRLSKPGDEWSVFDGNSFVPSRGSPYGNSPPPAFCAPVKSLAGAVGSVARIDGTEFFAAFSVLEGAVRVSFSTDLFNWSNSVELLRVNAYWAKSCLDGYKYNYVSVLDATTSDRNFGTIGKTPYLFIVRMKCSDPKERDLVALPLKFLD